MSKTMCNLQVAFTVNSSEHLPSKDGEQMYSDDVADELRSVIEQAVDAWYLNRGKDLLACEPIL